MGRKGFFLQPFMQVADFAPRNRRGSAEEEMKCTALGFFIAFQSS